MSRIFGFKNRYPQSFLDNLAKALGIKWTKAKPTLIDPKDVEVRPLPPPSGTLYYMEVKYGDDKANNTNDTQP